MQKITASQIVRAIEQLPRNQDYNYINPRTKGLIRIQDVQSPAGPIVIRRFNPSKGESFTSKEDETIPSAMIWRIANALQPGNPINFDRVLGGSYNTRSVLESLMAHTAQFYYCYPGRIEDINSTTEIKAGHKHLLWEPEDPHETGIIIKKETNIAISEIPNVTAVYDSITLADHHIDKKIPHDEDLKRRHAQIQVALVLIGQQLGFRTWVAQNDKGIEYKGEPLGTMPTVIQNLQDEKLVTAYSEAINAAKLIDCIWFRNAKFMPAVMEIEHSTGVTSGLTRMKGFQDQLPPFPTRWVIVAPDEDREKVIKKANKPQFQDLQTKFFPYSAVEELYSLCQRRKIKGVNDEFLDCFMEAC